MSRVALVTGGTRGIGAAIALALNEAGYRVAVTYVGSADASMEFARRNDLSAHCWSVNDYEACVKGLGRVEAELGPVDILVNNAGITRDGMFHKMSPEAWHQVMETNLTGVFNMTQPVWNGMRDRQFGRVINISSINGQKGQAGQVNYSAAKAGLLGFTKALAQEGARFGITVNAICPGYVATEMVKAIPDQVRDRIVSQIPIGRLGEPQEIARCVTFLAADDASFITGSTLTANGGQYIA